MRIVDRIADVAPSTPVCISGIKIHYQAEAEIIYKIYGNKSVFFFFSFFSFFFFFCFLQTQAVKRYKLVSRLTEVIIGTTIGTILAGLSNYQEKPLARYVVKSR